MHETFVLKSTNDPIKNVAADYVFSIVAFCSPDVLYLLIHSKAFTINDLCLWLRFQCAWLRDAQPSLIGVSLIGIGDGIWVIGYMQLDSFLILPRIRMMIMICE